MTIDELLLKREEIQRIKSLFQSLSAKDTYRILNLILKHPKGIVVGEIHQTLNFSQAEASQRLRVLRENKLVSATKEGQFVRYTANRENIATVMNIYNILSDLK